jgi:signal transduction histidine kinase
MAVANIERYFLNTLIKVSLGGVSVILFFDVLLNFQDRLSIIIDVIILIACVIALVAKNKYPLVSTMVLTIIVLAAMLYQCFSVPVNTTTSMSIILVIGFIFSVLLKGWVLWSMHLTTFFMINVVFVIQYQNPSLALSKESEDVITIAIAYSVLYFILAYVSGLLKGAYDNLYTQLNEKAIEIEAQNEQLRAAQANLNEMNLRLENIVIERTSKIKAQHQVLLRYSYNNAHHLRGPVARLLGLANISKIDPTVKESFIISKMEEQALEIDQVVNKINKDLESMPLVDDVLRHC